ncbi:MAG: DNRLRE domain-containing protein [Terriglobales bacterium]
MKKPTRHLHLFSLLSVVLLACSATYGQITPLGDTYTSSGDPTTNYGAQKTLDVDAAKEITYIQFNLASIPSGASVSQATLKLYVNTVVTAGAFEVYAVNGTWSESTLTYDLAPALGSVIDSNVPITTAEKNQYILIPMTSTVQGWLNTPSSNYGIALVAVGSFDATFDSKEATTTSHSAELDVVFAGDGTVTSVATGTGLTGGPITGSGTISLLTSCSSGQVLQWNGSAWACSSAGAGTVTSVGSGTGLAGGPITGSGTLSIAANACASGSALSALPFTCSPFATLATNTFTGNQTVDGNTYMIGDTRVDYSGINTGGVSPAVRFGSGPTGEAISSDRAGTVNVKGIDLYTDNAARLSVTNGGSVGIGTQAPAYMLDVHGTGNFTGAVTFAAGQAFPGTATLGANTFTGNQIVNANLSATGVVTGSSFQIGSNLFAFGSYANNNAFLGFAGNITPTAGFANTAVGYAALGLIENGLDNTAVGYGALGEDCISECSGSQGSFNTASGYLALSLNTTGFENIGIGLSAGTTVDGSYLTGSNNTALGSGAYFSTGTLNNATAIGANAEVSESNALVLGSIKGVNNATSNTNVGIGTTAPLHPLDVAGTVNVDSTSQNNGTFGNNLNFGSSSGEGISSSRTSGSINQYGLDFWTNNARQMSLTHSGQLGIGTDSPDSLLSVNGSADKPGGGSWGTFSDGRLKNLNGSYSSGLSQILRINPIRYRYKPDNAMGIRDTDEHIGVVAQDVQRVIPEAVTENSKGYLLVNNDPVIWATVNAIKEQQKEIQHEQAANAEQRKEFLQQQAQLAKALRQIKQQQSLLRAQRAEMRNLQAEVRETRETLRKVKVQVAASQLTVVATK